MTGLYLLFLTVDDYKNFMLNGVVVLTLSLNRTTTMIASTLPDLEIPGSRANEFGVTVNVGHFDPLTVEVPPITNLPPWGYITITVYVDGTPVAGSIVDASNPTCISIDIPPFAVRCCWQAIRYEVSGPLGGDQSNIVYVLNEGGQSN
ncbi:hypothetical protein [Pseudomonas sp. CFBP13528]|uniref:hypothetical protein n=1 Tax=Pseudomonas sp. CFBP13528 TaxID=2184006 RepID=UPI0010C057EF|nr:hypothetical protein [Pseudomonas sp. CFBP13528]